MMNQPTGPYREFQNSVAMTVTLISFGMMFATLFLGYLLVRFNTPTWPPVEIQGMPKLLPFMSTLVMVLSSLTYWRMQMTSQRLWWVLTLALGCAFLALQWSLWATLKTTGILVGNGMVPSMVYAFTWLHAGHIVLGLFGLLYIGHYLWRGQADRIKVINVGKFWHFLGVVWLVMYLTLFVL